MSSSQSPNPLTTFSNYAEGSRATKLQHLTDDPVNGGDDDDDSYDQGDYSTRIEELLSDEDASDDDDDSGSSFIYTGIDAEVSSGNYHDQLRDVLGHEADVEEDEVERSLIPENEELAVADRAPVSLAHACTPQIHIPVNISNPSSIAKGRLPIAAPHRLLLRLRF
jgi:hypothetical protein